MNKISSIPIRQEFYASVKQVLDLARKQSVKAINNAMVEAYWNIGALIVEEEQQGQERADYGIQLLESLATQLTNDFGKGFKARNLRYMRSFYLTFPNWNAVRSELSWTHYRMLLQIPEETKRRFYLQESITNAWSTRELYRQIHSLYYERHINTGGQLISPGNGAPESPVELLKDPYVLEFLDLDRQNMYKERHLEDALIRKLQFFLLELGKGFAFVARQKRITTESGKHFYIDLVFYHFILRCFILIDLKIGELKHENIGQMDMYVRLYEDKWRRKEDNPTLGIILCSEKDQTIVKYSVLQESEQLFASRYQLYLPTVEELQHRLKKDLEVLRIKEELDIP